MSFSEIIGHQKQKAELREILESGRLAPAYLFSGPEGIGKARLAIGFAEELIEERIVNHPDLLIVEPPTPNSPIKIDQIRRVRECLSRRPYRARYQVAIIDEADKMNAESQNCLLKTLEEPAGSSVIILVSSRKGKLFPTIRSRCQDVIFRPMGLDELTSELVRRLSISPERAHFLSCLSGGRYGWALNMKENDFFKDKNSLIDELFNGEVWPEDKDDLTSALKLLMSWYRDLLISRSGAKADLIANADRQNDLARQAGNFTDQEIEDSLVVLDSAFRALAQNANIRLLVEDIKTSLVRK